MEGLGEGDSGQLITERSETTRRGNETKGAMHWMREKYSSPTEQEKPTAKKKVRNSMFYIIFEIRVSKSTIGTYLKYWVFTL